MTFALLFFVEIQNLIGKTDQNFKKEVVNNQEL